MGPLPPEPGPGKINITPQDVANAAKTFAKGQDDLVTAWETLQSALDDNAGMAGNDDPAKKFNDKYAPGYKAAWKVLHQGVLTLGGMSGGLTTTANNFVKADHHSTPGRSTKPPPLFQREPVYSDVLMPDADPALGGGHSSVPGWMAKYWPNADTGKLRNAAKAWHAAASAIDGVNGKANTAITGLAAVQDDDSSKAINEFWATVYQAEDPKTVLAGMHKICQALGDACDKYAATVDSIHSKMKHALVGAGIAIGFTTALGILLTPFTFGGSDAGAGAADAAEAAAILGPIAEEAVTTVATETAAAIGEDLVAVVETAAEEAPTVEAVEADTTEIEGALDKEMAETEGEKTPEVETGDGRYSGNLAKVNKPDPDADALAERMGGESRVKFENDPDGREFDAVSDDYVGQAKPANFQVGKAFRDQAKATFEAARESGRGVYYHFDGEPQPGVIAKLNEYAARYGVHLKIDTNPF